MQTLVYSDRMFLFEQRRYECRFKGVWYRTDQEESLTIMADVNAGKVNWSFKMDRTAFTLCNS